MKAYRVARGWTQDEMAERLGLSQSDVSNVEGARRKPSRNMLEALRGRLGISTDWMLYGEGDGPLEDTGKDQVKRGKIDGMLGLGGGGNYGRHGNYGGGGVMRDRGPQTYGPPKKLVAKTGWGYADRKTPEEVRLRAAVDSGLRGTSLEKLVIEDANWELIQPLTGAEMEYLRAYCEAAGDPPMLHYVVALEFLRRVILSADDAEERR